MTTEKREDLICPFNYFLPLFLFLFLFINSTSILGQISEQKISGYVTSESGEVLIGVSILVKGSEIGAITDIDGHYSLCAREGEVLVFRYIGFEPIEKTIKQTQVVNVVLKELSQELEDVVVVGYGTQKKENVIASIETITTKELRMPNRSLSNNIAGQLAGIIAIQRSGEPGNDAASFWIRGQSSYAGATSPLVLVDGVKRAMNDVDVDEIETFSILKDAAATAVYGAEGANGVILITTKRGTTQKTQITISMQQNIMTPTRVPSLIAAPDYLTLYNEAKWNEMGNPELDASGNPLGYEKPFSDEIIRKHRTGEDPDLYPNVNWMNLLAKHSYSSRYNINIRGGSEKYKFFVSGSYFTENGIFRTNPIEKYDANIGLDRYNLRSNIDIKISPTCNLSVDMSGQYKTHNTPGRSIEDIFHYMVIFPTHYIPMEYSDGTASQHNEAANQRYNPYNLLNHSGYIKRWSVQIQSKVGIVQNLDFIIKGLSFSSAISFDANSNSSLERIKTPTTYFAKGRDDEGNLIKEKITDGTSLGDPKKGSVGGRKRLYIEAKLNYSRKFADHSINALLLYNQRETQYLSNSDGIEMLPHRKQNVVSRLSYNYKSKYFLEVSFGASGSENFNKGNRWGVFPAASIGWYLSNEKFMEKLYPFLSKLKLRGSIGYTGNDYIPGNRFPYREKLSENSDDGAWGYSFGISPGVGGKLTNTYGGIREMYFASPFLTWEKERTINLGLELAFFKGRYSITTEMFSSRRSDILITRKTIPSSTGFREFPNQNFGISQKRGIEFSAVVKQKLPKNMLLTARCNFTYVKTKVVEYDEIQQEYAYMAYTGRMIGKPKVYIAEGLYTPDDFNIERMANTGAEVYTLKQDLPKPTSLVAPGDIKYKDLNNDRVIDAKDMTYENNLSPTVPRIIYGFGVNVERKGAYFALFFQGVGKTSANLLNGTDPDATFYTSPFIPFFNGVNYSSARVQALDRWTHDDPYNEHVLFPRMRTEKYRHNLLRSTWWFRDASFLRLKSVELGYNFSKKQLQNLKISGIKLFVQGTNLYVWDKIKYWDPEIGAQEAGAKYPLSKTWTFGIEFKL